jgi:hypothetical protein
MTKKVPEPIRGLDLAELQYELDIPAGDLQRVLGISAYDWGLYVNRTTHDGDSPILTEPAISILTRLYQQHPEAFPLPASPSPAEVLELVNSDRVPKAEVRKLEAQKGIKPSFKMSYAERAQQLGLRLEVPMTLFAKTLGKQETAGGRWIRGALPPPAIRNILIYMKMRIEADGDSRVFDEISEYAQSEATARGMGNLSDEKGWKTTTRADLIASIDKPEE